MSTQTTIEQTTTGHTRGPWDYFVGNASGRGLIRIETSCNAPAAGLHIASLTRGDQQEANARLIASAPDLLTALAGLLNTTELNLDDLEPETREAIDVARATYARATGRNL